MISHVERQGWGVSLAVMNIFIGHETALAYWQSISLDRPGSYPRGQEPLLYGKGVFGGSRSDPFRLEKRRDFLPQLLGKTPSLSKCKPSSDALEKAARYGAELAQEPVDVLVSSASGRWYSPRVRCHVQEVPFPAKSFVRLERGIYIASPELVFVQMASQLPLHDLLLLGFELCGTYSTWESDYKQRPPLSTLDRLLEYVGHADSMRGVVKARRALKYIAEASASPKESVLALFLGLPRSMGGYGLGIPRMNWEVSVAGGSSKSAAAEPRYVDLYWPKAKLAVEYDSDLHTGSDKIAADAVRRNALLAVGVQEITVTKKQLYSAAEVDKAARAVAGLLGKRLRPVSYDETRRRMQLRQSLLFSAFGADSGKKLSF